MLDQLDSPYTILHCLWLMGPGLSNCTPIQRCVFVGLRLEGRTVADLSRQLGLRCDVVWATYKDAERTVLTSM